MRATITAIGVAMTEGNKEIAKRLYESAQSQYMDMLIKQYRGELEDKVKKELKDLSTTLTGYAKDFTTDQTATLKQQVETLTKKGVEEIQQNEASMRKLSNRCSIRFKMAWLRRTSRAILQPSTF